MAELAPRSQPTVYASCFNAVLQAVSARGIERSLMLEQVGLASTALDVSSERIPVAKYLALYALAQEHTSNPDLGLDVGRIIFFTGLNLQLYMTTICRNLREYLNVIPSTISMRGDLGRIVIEGQGDCFRLQWRPLDPATARLRPLSDEMLASSAYIVGSICALPVPVVRAEFSYPKPANVEALTRVFTPELHFDCPVSCLYFPRESLRYPLINLDYDLGAQFKAGPRSLFDAGDVAGIEDAFLRDTRRAIRRALPGGQLTIDNLSDELGISRRTLQRRLNNHGSSFKTLLQATREELALKYLADTRLGMTDIAFLLGYADQASFSNAFRGWRDCTPSEYRSGGGVR